MIGNIPVTLSLIGFKINICIDTVGLILFTWDVQIVAGSEVHVCSPQARLDRDKRQDVHDRERP